MFILLFILVIIGIFYMNQNIYENIYENFAFVPWNIGTRFYKYYDIRGYPRTYNQIILKHKKKIDNQIFSWNYPYPGLPFLYFSPYFYESTGKYIFNNQQDEQEYRDNVENR